MGQQKLFCSIYTFLCFQRETMGDILHPKIFIRNFALPLTINKLLPIFFQNDVLGKLLFF